MVKWRSRETRDNLFMAEKENRTIVLYDVETTGLNAEKDKVIQLSGIKFRIEGGKAIEIARFDKYINPEIPIPPKITEITGITDDMVFDKQTEKELFPEIADFFGISNVISGYNVAKFDNRFIANMFKRNGSEFKPYCTVDVLEMARDIVDAKDTENFKLGTMASRYGVDEGLTFHNSMDDVIATKDLLVVFLQEYRDTYDEDEGLLNVEPTPEEGKKQVTSVHSIRFWEGYKGFSRLYIGTNLGEFYYDIRKHLWSVNSKSNPYTVDEVDMESLKWQAFKKSDAKNEAEFVQNNTPHKNKEIKDITTVNAMKYWERIEENGKQFHRIYITTDVGNFYYDIDKKRWCSNGGDVNVSVDMEKLKALCFEKAGVSNEAEFAMYR